MGNDELGTVCRETRAGWCDVHEAPWGANEAVCERAGLEDSPA